MAKDILDLKNEADLTEYLEEMLVEVKAANQIVKDEISDIEYIHANDIFSIKTIEDLEGLDTHSIFYYIQAIQAMALNVNDDASRRLGHLGRRIESRLMHIPEVLDAWQIQKHWKAFNKHLDDSPTLREEWDALCMGIKLTEDE